MTVRDARPDDLAAVADLAETSTAAMETMLTQRTIRVVVSGDDEIRGFVAFDATESKVEITRIAGESRVMDRLLEEPLAFGADAGLPVETVVPSHDDGLQAALLEAGFAEYGSGPTFRGTRTIRYRAGP